MMPRPVFFTFTIICVTTIGCSDSTRPPDSTARIHSAQVVANPNMEISALVLFLGAGDSMRVRYRIPAQDEDSLTPAFPVTSAEEDTVPVLGLMPGTAYELRLVVYGGGSLSLDSLISDPLSFTSGPLPPDLPAYTAGGITPLDGYIVFSAAQFGIIIDGTGRVVWYKRFSGIGPGLNFMAQPNGALVGQLNTADSTDDDPFIEVDPAGFEGRRLRCVNNRPLRFHDLLLSKDASYWIMCDETRPMDLSAVGGDANAQVTGTALQHVDAAGNLLFEWTPFDHFLITDADASVYEGVAEVNWTHGNSFDFDTDGNILISFRSLNEITKINSQTGAVMWRMGGLRNQFTLEGLPGAGFLRQHNVRVVGPGRFIILDNLNVGITESRYERYLLSADARTATLEQSYGSTPRVTTLIGGSVQAADPDRYLVSFGTEGRVELFDGSGIKLWNIEGDPGYVFRAQRILSLYAPVPVLTR